MDAAMHASGGREPGAAARRTYITQRCGRRRARAREPTLLSQGKEFYENALAPRLVGARDGWGGNIFVVGGAVKGLGGRVLGTLSVRPQ